MKNNKYIICDDFVGSDEVARKAGFTKKWSHVIIKKINDNLARQGKLILPGHLPRDIFDEYLKTRREK